MFTKIKKAAQAAGIGSGWKHVDKFTRRKANKVLRRLDKYVAKESAGA